MSSDRRHVRVERVNLAHQRRRRSPPEPCARPDHQRDVVRRILSERHVEERPRRFQQIAVLRRCAPRRRSCIHRPFTCSRRPTGSRPRQYCAAIVSSTMATGGAVSSSARVNSRPETSGMPIVARIARADFVVVGGRLLVRRSVVAVHRDRRRRIRRDSERRHARRARPTRRRASACRRSISPS